MKSHQLQRPNHSIEEHNSNVVKAHVAVLLCTHNGEQYLEDQLGSILLQNIERIDVWASDDGSTDQTPAILAKYAKSWKKGKFIIKRGPQKGFAANFLSLASDPQIAADYYAYSDQDDIWKNNKLSRAIHVLSEDVKQASLYCSRTNLISSTGKLLRKQSVLPQKQAHFRNALVQSLAGGNTMVFNQPAKNLLSQAGMVNVISHDWWTYMLISGAEGKVFYDKIPSVFYRQHSSNLVGANNNFFAVLARFGTLFNGRFREWNEVNIAALFNSKQLLTQENLFRLEQFCELRHGYLLKRLHLAKKAGIYRQTFLGNLALIAAILMKKI